LLLLLPLMVEAQLVTVLLLLAGAATAVCPITLPTQRQVLVSALSIFLMGPLVAAQVDEALPEMCKFLVVLFWGGLDLCPRPSYCCGVVAL